MKPEQAALLGYGDRVKVDPRYIYHARPGGQVRGEVSVFDCVPCGDAIGRYTATVVRDDGQHVQIDAHWLEKAR